MSNHRERRNGNPQEEGPAASKGLAPVGQETQPLRPKLKRGFMALGFTPVARPGDQLPDLPDDFDTVPNEGLSSRHIEFVKWEEYARQEQVTAANELRQCRRELEQKILDVEVRASPEERKAAIRKVRLDPEVIALEDGIAELEAAVALIEGLVHRFVRDAFVVSREMTMRAAGEPRQRRADNQEHSDDWTPRPSVVRRRSRPA